MVKVGKLPDSPPGWLSRADALHASGSGCGQAKLPPAPRHRSSSATIFLFLSFMQNITRELKSDPDHETDAANNQCFCCVWDMQ